MTQNTDKPSTVSGAVGLLYVTMAIGAVRTVLEWTHITTIASSDFALITIVLTFVIQLWLIHKIDQGRNWSRILFALLFVLGVPFSIQPLLQSLSGSPISGFLGIAQLGLQVIALFMLFSGAARCWFHPDAPATSSAAPLILLVLLLGGAAFFFLHDSSRPFTILPPQAAITPTPSAPVATQSISVAAPQFATAAEAQREAIRLYPALGVADSPFNRAFLARYKQYQQQRPDYFRDTAWPVTLAREIATTNSQ